MYFTSSFKRDRVSLSKLGTKILKYSSKKNLELEFKYYGSKFKVR